MRGSFIKISLYFANDLYSLSILTEDEFENGIPCSEQKKPCRHLEQSSFDEVVFAGATKGTGFLGLDAAFNITGFSVVCLPVLHLH